MLGEQRAAVAALIVEEMAAALPGTIGGVELTVEEPIFPFTGAATVAFWLASGPPGTRLSTEAAYPMTDLSQPYFVSGRRALARSARELPLVVHFRAWRLPASAAPCVHHALLPQPHLCPAACGATAMSSGAPRSMDRGNISRFCILRICAPPAPRSRTSGLAPRARR